MMDTAESFTPPPEAGATGDVMQWYSKVWPHVQVAVEFCARDLASDREEREELVQEGRLELWRPDASKCDIRSREDLLYLRAMLTTHVRRVSANRRREAGAWFDGFRRI